MAIVGGAIIWEEASSGGESKLPFLRLEEGALAMPKTSIQQLLSKELSSRIGRCILSFTLNDKYRSSLQTFILHHVIALLRKFIYLAHYLHISSAKRICHCKHVTHPTGQFFLITALAVHRLATTSAALQGRPVCPTAYAKRLSVGSTVAAAQTRRTNLQFALTSAHPVREQIFPC